MKEIGLHIVPSMLTQSPGREKPLQSGSSEKDSVIQTRVRTLSPIVARYSNGVKPWLAKPLTRSLLEEVAGHPQLPVTCVQEADHRISVCFFFLGFLIFSSALTSFTA